VNVWEERAVPVHPFNSFLGCDRRSSNGGPPMGVFHFQFLSGMRQKERYKNDTKVTSVFQFLSGMRLFEHVLIRTYHLPFNSFLGCDTT